MGDIIMNITGHRPESLLSSPQWVRQELTQAMQDLGVTKIYQGMAAGVDLWAAGVAWKLGIPYVACRPWAGHKPRKEDHELYNWVLAHAAEIVHISDAAQYPGAWVYHARNEYMVDHAPDGVLAVWNGNDKGGTAACIKYAKRMQRRIYRIDPSDVHSTGWIDYLNETKPESDLFSLLEDTTG